MYYKNYGNTGMRVSAVGLGTMRYDDTDVSAGRLEECAEIPLYAYEKGINYFDTAPSGQWGRLAAIPSAVGWRKPLPA